MITSNNGTDASGFLSVVIDVNNSIIGGVRADGEVQTAPLSVFDTIDDAKLLANPTFVLFREIARLRDRSMILHTAGNGEELTIAKTEQVIEALEMGRAASVTDAVRLIRFLVHVIEQPAAEPHDSLPVALCAAVGRLENARARVAASADRDMVKMKATVDGYAFRDLDTAARQVLRFTAQGLGLAV